MHPPHTKAQYMARKNCERPLNIHPSTADTHDIADTPLIHIADSFQGPNCTERIHNGPDLVDTHQPFQQDFSPAAIVSYQLKIRLVLLLIVLAPA